MTRPPLPPRHRGILGGLLGIEEHPPPPLPACEVDVSDGDIVELLDDVAREVEVLARLGGRLRVCRLTDGAKTCVVVLDRTGNYWEASPGEPEGEVVAESFHEERAFTVRMEGRRVSVRTPEGWVVADLEAEPVLGATWVSPRSDDGIYGERL